MVLCVVLSGCAKAKAPGAPGLPSTTLAKIAKAETDVTFYVGQAEQIVQTFFHAGTITASTASKINQILGKVTAANAEAITITQNLVEHPEQTGTINTIIKPIIAAVQDSLNNGLIDVQDPNVKATISASLSSLLIVLQTIQASTGS